MQHVLSTGRALADGNRLRLLMALRRGEVNFSELQTLVDVAPSTASKHMTILIDAGLVASRKAGRRVFYRMAAASEGFVAEVLRWTIAALEHEAEVHADQIRLAAIRHRAAAGKASQP